MFRKFVAAFVTILFAASLHTTAFAATINGTYYLDYKDELKAGDVIRTTGNGFFPEHWEQNKIFYKTFARQVARIDALRKIVETLEIKLNKFDLRFKTTVENHNVVTDRIETKIHQKSKAFELLEKNARQVGDVKFLEDNIYEVTMELILPANWKEYFKK